MCQFLRLLAAVCFVYVARFQHAGDKHFPYYIPFQ